MSDFSKVAVKWQSFRPPRQMSRLCSIDDMNMGKTFAKSRKVITDLIFSRCHGNQIKYQIDIFRIQILPETFKIGGIIDDVAFSAL